MEEIKRRIDELAKMVREGYMKDLAMLVGTAMLADDDIEEYITRGVEAAQYAKNKKKKKNDKADC